MNTGADCFRQARSPMSATTSVISWTSDSYPDATQARLYSVITCKTIAAEVLAGVLAAVAAVAYFAIAFPAGEWAIGHAGRFPTGLKLILASIAAVIPLCGIVSAVVARRFPWLSLAMLPILLLVIGRHEIRIAISLTLAAAALFSAGACFVMLWRWKHRRT